MNKSEFLHQLERLLADLAPEERSAALEYYTEYLDEAGEAGEADVLRELGSPEEVAAALHNARPTPQDWAAGYVGNDGTASFGTCCDDEAASPTPPPYTAGGAGGVNGAGGAGGGVDGAPGAPGGSGLGNLLWVLLLVCSIPLWCTLFGLLAGFAGALAALLGGGLLVVVAGVLACIGSAPLLATAFGSGLLNMGMALLATALGLVLFAAAVEGFAGLLPGIVRGARKLFAFLRKKVSAL